MIFSFFYNVGFENCLGLERQRNTNYKSTEGHALMKSTSVYN